jgi:GT2 family glycosyltransferase
MDSLSVVIPAYNEEANLSTCVEKVAKTCKSCKEKMIQEAIIASTDSFSRLSLPDGRSFVEDMMNGVYGRPDPSSALGAVPASSAPNVEVLR